MIVAAIVLAFMGFSACMSIMFGKAVHRLASENDYDWASFPSRSRLAGKKSSGRKPIPSR
jgi:hypothetical protein